MRVVVQRVRRARVGVDGETVGSVGPGLLLLVSAGQDDTDEDAVWTAGKILNLRIFADGEGKMNRSVLETGGGVLAVSQFTLHGDARKGNRPSFARAMAPGPAEALFNRFVALLREGGAAEVSTGRFGAMMDVELVNNGPVTILLDSKKEF